MRIFKLQSLSKLEWSSDWGDTRYRQNGNDQIAFCSEKGNGQIVSQSGWIEQLQSTIFKHPIRFST